MRIKNAAVSGMTIGLLALSAGTALAAPTSGPSLKLSPNTAHVGAEVTVTALCDGGAVSALDADVLGIHHSSKESKVTYVGKVRDLAPGVYDVSLTCSYPEQAARHISTRFHLVPPTTPNALVYASPSVGKPGDTVKVQGVCTGADGYVVISGALGVTWSGFKDPKGKFADNAVVKDIAPGIYDLKVNCFEPDGSTLSAHNRFTVQAKDAPKQAEPVRKAVAPVKQVAQVPKGAPQTGGGGLAA
ncbi:hypothetical protein AB5J62_14920 [Amycolatopsis sp. cg5]|uniref:hypothetical protein n=1 Tax=Amycolatopsis sp. cg5 TaxID=3238802 RepID=UPI003523B60E